MNAFFFKFFYSYLRVRDQVSLFTILMGKEHFHEVDTSRKLFVLNFFNDLIYILELVSNSMQEAQN
jgi:hypothetical protein